MLVLNAMMRYRLRRSTKKICNVFFRTLHESCGFSKERSTYAARFRTTRGCCFYERSEVLLPLTPLGKSICFPNYLQHYRLYSNNARNELPQLTDLPVQVRPMILANVKFLLMNFFTIKPQLDRDFSLASFLKTTDKVVQVVSNRLATSDYDALEEMVTPEVFVQIKKNLPHFTESQRQELSMKIEDIAISFIYDIQITENRNQTEKHLQITTIHHIVKGAEELRKMFENFTPFQNIMQPVQQQGASNHVNPIEEFKRQHKSLQGFVTNFRFLRTFNLETGTATDWLINGLNFCTRKLDIF